MLRFFYKATDGYFKIILVTTLCFIFVSSCYRYSAWNDAGIYETNVADEWIAAGFADPNIAIKWKNDGFSPEDAKAWTSTGFTDPDVAKKWKDADFNSQEAKAWKTAGFADSDKARDWKIAGFTPQEAFSWSNSGFGIYSGDAALWKAAGFDLKETMAWQNAGFDNSTIAKEWKDVGFSLNEAQEWKMAGFNNPDEAKRLYDLGLSPQLAIQKKEKEKQALLRNPQYKSLVKKAEMICKKIKNLQSNSQCFWTFGEIMDRGENSLLLRGMALPLNGDYNVYGSNTGETNILIVEPSKSGIRGFESYLETLTYIEKDQYHMFLVMYSNKIASDQDKLSSSFYVWKHRFIKKGWGKNAFGGDVPVWVYGDVSIPQSILDKCRKFKVQLAGFGTKEFPDLGSEVAGSCDCGIPSCN
jgi:ribosomal protein S16